MGRIELRPMQIRASSVDENNSHIFLTVQNRNDLYPEEIIENKGISQSKRIDKNVVNGIKIRLQGN